MEWKIDIWEQIKEYKFYLLCNLLLNSKSSIGVDIGEWPKESD